VRLLKSLEKTSYEEFRIVIVDSTTPESRYLEFEPAAHFRDISRILRLKTTRGLPSARNLALSQMKSEDLVVFLDDDVSVSPDFFTKLNTYLLRNQNVQAVGVRISGQYITDKRRAFNAFLDRPGKNFGKVTRSGENIWVPDKDFGEIPVEWLPGCCMVFKTEVFRDLRFNEKLEDGPTSGYALGEDVDFTYACSRKFAMSATDSISITHHFEKSARDDAIVMSIASGMFKAHLKNSFPENFSDFRIIARQFMKYAWIYRRQSIVKPLRLTGKFTGSYVKERFKKYYQS
jgi:glycosyltransferase involved in cell wall biosynthesis